MSQHTELLSLIEHTGPFLTEPVLDRVFPQGIDPIEQVLVARLRSAHAEWTESQQRGDAESPKIHTTWIDMVLREGLGYEERSLRRGSAVPAELTVDLAEHSEKISPDMVLVNPEGRTNEGKARLLINIWPFGQDLAGQTKDSKWAATPIERMVTLCRATGAHLGLVTNGERWTLIDAREGQSPAVASWYARYWAPEPLTLRGFLCLLGARRFFGVPEADTIESLLTESSNYQQEVTDQLGLQVRQAVEVLIQALDRADKDRKRELLKDVDPGRLYDAALTVMMRLVFLFCAEERGLLLLGDPIYDSYYAVSTLRGLLREEADKIGLEVLERRHDAWARLLATFRGIYGGIYHENLRLPALGGSLFDPDRYPFLEGRSEKTSWKDTPAFPLPIDNRTVLHLLESLQLLKKKGGRGWQEARRLSFRALDVEQIGHVYEGLLDHVAVRVEGPTLGLIGAKGQEPEISIEALEKKKDDGEHELIEFLNEQTGRSVAALKNDLHRKTSEEIKSALLTACGNDAKLLERVLPFHAFVRDDVWGYPVIYQAESFMVTGGLARRSTGTHYTPRSLTEEIVRETLTPLVYEGPAEGKPRNEWKLKSANELLDLKICDMAMGSAAFLVQVCEWLGERVVEAWSSAEMCGDVVLVDGTVVDDAKGEETATRDKDERLLTARRLIAERCIYGVDINPMAVELAKLSIWLVTMAKGRPFGFLDHNLRSGDSLLGIYRLDQLTKLSMSPDDKVPMRLFGQEITRAVREAIQIRRKLREVRILDITDIEVMKRLDCEAKEKLGNIPLIADAMVGEMFRNRCEKKSVESALATLSGLIDELIRGKIGSKEKILMITREALAVGLPPGRSPHRPFHWVVEFPEVFERGSFDVMIGNPPFAGHKELTKALGATYATVLRGVFVDTGGKCDLVAFFFRRAFSLLKAGGCFGLIATKTIIQGDTRHSGLRWICANGGIIYSARKRYKWPGQAAVVVSMIHVVNGTMKPPFKLDGHGVSQISADLLPSGGNKDPYSLRRNSNMCFQGTVIRGMGFTFDDYAKKGKATSLEEMRRLILKDPRNGEIIHPYIGGQEVNESPTHGHHRYVIDFGLMSEDAAKQWPDLFEIVKQKVLVERKASIAKSSEGSITENFWRFGHTAGSLYQAVSGLAQVLVCARVSKTLAFTFLPVGMIFANTLNVFSISQYSGFCVLQSRCHEFWVRMFSSTFKDDQAYHPSDCFETFPFPEAWKDNARLEEAGMVYYKHRAFLMTKTNEGLTSTYNNFHDPNCTSPDILKLRELHRGMDKEVLNAYGWDDIKVECEFLPEHEGEESDNVDARHSKKRLKYRWPDDVRDEVLARLISLNVKLAAEEKMKEQKVFKKERAEKGQKEFFE